MTDQWFYKRIGVKSGPVPASTLGEVRSTTVSRPLEPKIPPKRPVPIANPALDHRACRQVYPHHQGSSHRAQAAGRQDSSHHHQGCCRSIRLQSWSWLHDCKGSAKRGEARLTRRAVSYPPTGMAEKSLTQHASRRTLRTHPSLLKIFDGRSQ